MCLRLMYALALTVPSFAIVFQDSDRKQSNSAKAGSTPKKAIPSSNRKTVRACSCVEIYLLYFVLH